MGLLDLIAPGNPVSPFLDQNRSNLVSGFAGMVGAGNDPRAALKGFAQGVQKNIPVQQRMQLEQQERAEKQTQIDLQHQQQNATIAFLQKKYPDLAAAASNGVPLANVYSEMWKREGGGGTDMSSTVQGRQQLAEQYGLTGNDAQMYVLTGKLPGANDSLRYGNSPIYAKDDKGNYIAVQPGTDGSVNVMQLPDGFHVDPGALNSDRAAGTAYGRNLGNIQFSLPQAQQTVENELANIQALRNDTQGLEETFGKVAGVFPQQWAPTLPGTAKADYKARLDQVVGQNFLQAFTTLKGAGAITEVEGTKAQEAMARLSTSQSKESYLRALDDLEAILKQGYARLSQQAGSGGYQSSGFSPPPIGRPATPSGQTSNGLTWSIEP